jgi:hypothetical protein
MHVVVTCFVYSHEFPTNAENSRVVPLLTPFGSCGPTQHPRRRSSTTRVLDGVGQNPDVFVNSLKGPIHLEAL